VRERVGIVIPVASLSRAKSRLADVLTPAERQSLVLYLLDRTLSAASDAVGVHEVLVVSPDPAVLDRVHAAGAQGVRQRSRGLNPALREAEARLASHHLTTLVILPIDLPLLRAEELERLVKVFAAARAGGPGVALVPDRQGTGTNALFIAPPGLIAFRFGKGSRRRHEAAARQVSATYVEFESLLKIDLDEPADLSLVDHRPLATRLSVESPIPRRPSSLMTALQ
jgi:2-phospho-L-lactate guanylyltransferase